MARRDHGLTRPWPPSEGDYSSVTVVLLTPTKITAWLDCAHFLSLQHEVDQGIRAPASFRAGAMSEMLKAKGLQHEQAVLVKYRAQGRTVLEVPGKARGESFQRWTDRVAPILDEGHDVLYQMPLVHDGIRGVADFLERVDHGDGSFGYQPVDAKLARREAKPGHVLQLCFYADALAARTGTLPKLMHLELGAGGRESIRVDEVLAYWRRLRAQLASVVAAPPQQPTRPEPCGHCAFCEFEQVCQDRWRAEDSLVHVAGLRRADRVVLEAGGVSTIAQLAGFEGVLPDLDADRLTRSVTQAALQVRARNAPDERPPFQLLDPILHAADPSADQAEDATDPVELAGLAALPRPHAGDVFLDFEGHPFWKPEVGLFFLFGLIEHGRDGWGYRTFWAHDQAQEAQAVRGLVDHLTERKQRFPDMHVYHYNHTERSSLERLTREYGVAELELEQLVTSGTFVDLYPIIVSSVQIGVESYGLKQVERLTEYVRSHDIDRGAGAVVEYEAWTADLDGSRLDRIARYNEDDVRATRAVRDWLVAHRPAELAWPPALVEAGRPDPELDARIEALHAYGPGTPEHLMGDLLGYWRREDRAVAADCLRLSIAEEADQRESPQAIAGLAFREFEDRLSTRTGRPLKWQAAVFTFPPQPVDPEIKPDSTLILALQEHKWAFFNVAAIDREAGLLKLIWDQEAIDAGVSPTHLVHYQKFPTKTKQQALSDLAQRMLDGAATSVGHAMLRRDLPRFRPGTGPAGGRFVGGYEAICGWAGDLDASCVPVQGPPGTGKTFTGAHVIRALVGQGKRVGVTALSHYAIDNQLQAVVDRFAEDGGDLRAVRKATGGSVRGVDYIDDNGTCATGDYNVVGGTPWLFASKDMRAHPVDVLIVDEAGQLGLADTLAATISAATVILLGDPQQLPQVSQATHPNGSGASALEHLLGGHPTIPSDRGVLLDITWRMHPDVCKFISEVFYESRVHTHPSCAEQTTAHGTGLRWLRAEHTGRSSEAPEEVALIQHTIGGLLGTPWTDRHGITRLLAVKDFVVVAPYNDQRRLISETFDADPATRGIEVGTVDKFQGREAAVVLFSMATSSADLIPRNADFLFSRNRLNVAISRARCLAYLICTDRLLNTRARDIHQMILLSALCSFVESASPVVAGTP